MHPLLKDKIVKLYDIFDKYKGNRSMQGSANYDNVGAWNKELFSKPLAQLTDGDLSRFTGKVMTTWGGVSDLKHFLPRILELTAAYQNPYEIWITFDKLELAKWQEWELQESTIVVEFFEALLHDLLDDNSRTPESEFEDYFTSLLYYHPKTTDLLKIVDSVESKAKYKHLSSLIVDQENELFKKGRLEGFNKFSKNVDAFKDWLLQSKTAAAFGTAFFKYEEESFSEKISWSELIISREIKTKNNSEQH